MKAGARAIHFAHAVAARAFGTRIAHRRQRPPVAGWRPVALRWKRPVRRPNAPRWHVGPASAAPVLWSPHFHLHMTAVEGERIQPVAPIVALPTQVMRQIHHSARRVFRTINRSERVAGPVQWLERIARADGAPAATPLASTARPLQRRTSRRRQMLAQPTNLGSRPAQTVAAAIPMTERGPYRGTPVTMAARSTTPGHGGPAAPHARAPQLLLPMPRASTKPATTGRLSYPPVDIVWSRRRSVSSDEAGTEPGSRLDRSSAWTAQVLRASQESPLPAPPPLAPRPVPLTLTDVDPRFLDRLTDDVIRRVERRVRIERERRGL